MKKLIIHLYENTGLGNNIVFQKCINACFIVRSVVLSDEKLLKRAFKKSFGYDIDFDNPITFSEKIQWLKLYDRTPLLTQCADKYKVRDFIRDKIGENYLVPLLFETKNPKDINPENIPGDMPVFIKTNHDSSGGIIIKDNSKVNWKNIQSTLSKLLNKSYYYSTQEWEYKNIERRIMVEKLLSDKNDNMPIDCKILCFNGKVKLITMISDSGLPTHSASFYDINWNKKDIKLSSLINSEMNFVKPKNLDKIITLSEVLSKDFIHVRVDWLYVNERFYNGEMTFHTASGLNPFKPKKWEEIIGDYIRLPAVLKNSNKLS